MLLLSRGAYLKYHIRRRWFCDKGKREMDRTLTLDFPSGKRIAFSYPQSATMDAVVEKILRHNEYGKLWFIQAKTIVDIGANVGCASVFFAVAHPQATVYALEPAKEAFDYLKKNTAELANV